MPEYTVGEESIESYGSIIVEFDRTIEDPPIFIDSTEHSDGTESFILSDPQSWSGRKRSFGGLSPAFPDPVAVDYARGVVYDCDMPQYIYGDLVDVKPV